MKQKIYGFIAILLVICFALTGCKGNSDNPQDEKTGQADYSVLSCVAQNFSVLHNSSFTGVAYGDGAIIYMGDEDELNRVEIALISNENEGDFLFDASEYFYFFIEGEKYNSGVEYTLYEPYIKVTYADATLSGAIYSFDTEDGVAYRYELILEKGVQVVCFSCYYYEGESESPIQAMYDAINSYQPSANYYDSHPLVIDNNVIDNNVKQIIGAE